MQDPVIGCLDSLDVPDPNTNFQVNVRSPNAQAEFETLELQTLELPSSQMLIEQLWSRMYMMREMKFTEEDEASRTLRFEGSWKEEPVVISATFPLTLNPIIDVSKDSIYTTKFPHLLETRSYWPRPWRLTGVVCPRVLEEVEIVSPTQFRVATSRTETLTAGGYLEAPPLCSFVTLADIGSTLLCQDITKVTQVVSSRKMLLLHFLANKGRFVFDVMFGILHKFLQSLRLVVSPGSLATRLGFQTCPLQSQCVAISSPSFGVFHIRLASGNYPSISLLVQELNAKAQLLWFETVATLHYQQEDKDWEVEVLPGWYTPNTMAQALSDSNLTWSFDCLSGFTVQSKKPFQLVYTPLLRRLGFAELTRQGNVRYCSDESLHYRQDNCLLHFQWSLQCNQRILFTWTSLPEIDYVMEVVTGNFVTILTPTRAHGFQEGQVLIMNPQQIEAVLVNVLSSTRFVIDVGGQNLDPTGRVRLRDPCGPLSTLMCPRFHQNGFLAKILGLPKMDRVFWINVDPTQSFVTPEIVNLERQYVVTIEIREPTQSAKFKLLGKALVTPNTPGRILDLPMTLRLTAPCKLPKLHVRFLNSDGSLYELHGKPWRMTLLMR